MEKSVLMRKISYGKFHTENLCGKIRMAQYGILHVRMGNSIETGFNQMVHANLEQ
jgi:hypothetical protein